MKLKCRINGKDYDIVSGATFSEEYNETLDSGSIIIDQIKKIKDLKPFDDVFVWNANGEFEGYQNYGDMVSPESLNGSISASYAVDEEAEEDDWVEETGNVSVFRTSTLMTFYGIPANIWSSLYGLEVGSEQWQSDGMSLQLGLIKNDETNIMQGTYTIDPNANRLLSDKKILRMDLKDGESVVGNPPIRLYVPINIFTPSMRFADHQNRERVFNIQRYAKPTPIFSLGDTYKIVSSDLGLSATYKRNKTAKKKINIEISGLSFSQLKNMKGKFKFSTTSSGMKATFFCDPAKDAIFYDSNETITMRFKAYDDKYFSTYHDSSENECAVTSYITLRKGSDGVWRSDDELKIYIKYSPDYRDDHQGVSPNARTIFADYIDFTGFTDDITVPVQEETVLPSFFKHMLVDSFNCEMVDLSTLNRDSEGFEGGIYKYKIDLMSETKWLEKIILPNISITQPIVGQKRTVLSYLKQYVDLYSPKIKFALSGNRWEYRNRFKIDERVSGSDDEYIGTPISEIFTDDIYAPEMSLTAPTLREVLSRLMIVKDCIPVVKNNVIYAMKISDTHGVFGVDNDHFSFISENMSSENYSTSFRREYGDAISQKNSTHMVEYMGFRNKENALMTLDNMCLETRFPIYKINSIYLCFYKSISVTDTARGRTYNKLVLVRHDISKLILQEEVRNALAADWTIIQSRAWENINIDEMSKWRVFTLGYSIGSNRISGWGDKISYIADPLGLTQAAYTYIEVIIDQLDKHSPFGEARRNFLAPNEILTPNISYGWRDRMVHPSYPDNLPIPVNNTTEQIKSLFFKMDYIGMYSGAIVHSKENVEDNGLQTADNCSSALTILEVDGLFEREKANRVANPEMSFIARFEDVDEMNDTRNCVLGSYWGESAENGVVIYHKEYQIFDDYVGANFVGTRDYVMKNYFTTVYARYRTYSYASYAESVNRSENDRYSVTLSDEICLFDGSDATNGLLNVSSIISAFSETYVDPISLMVGFPNQINGGYFSFPSGDFSDLKYKNSRRFFSDIAQFVSGYSLCFNIRTFDTTTAGVYISNFNCYDVDKDNSRNSKYIGSAQDWWKLPISQTDGFIEEIGCYFGHFEDGDIIKNNIEWGGGTSNNELFEKLFELPLQNREATFQFGKVYDFRKDNKEIIDFTLQYELMNEIDDVFTSEWLMKLTDFSDYKKFSTDRTIADLSGDKKAFRARFWSEVVNWNAGLILYGGWTYRRGLEVTFEASDVNSTSWQNPVSLLECKSDVYSFSYNSSDLHTTYRRVIELTTVNEVVKNSSNEVTGLKIQVVEINIENDVAVSTKEVLFNKVSDASTQTSYVFRYVGQDDTIVSGVGGNFENLLLDNGKTADNPYVTYGGIINQTNPKNYPKTMYILTSTEEIDPSMVYRQFKPNEIPSNMTVKNVTPYDALDDGHKFSDIFNLTADEYGRPFIQFKANSILGSGYKSVQYWYYDADGDGYMHFVFGVNKTEDAKIYISIEKSRSRKVFDVWHNVIGETMNFADDENADDYGKKLYVEVD